MAAGCQGECQETLAFLSAVGVQHPAVVEGTLGVPFTLAAACAQMLPPTGDLGAEGRPVCLCFCYPSCSACFEGRNVQMFNLAFLE